MQTRFMERSKSMKRGLGSSSAENNQPDRKRPALASVIVEAIKVDSLHKICSSLEPILRRIVSEEVECAISKLGPAKLMGRSSPKHIEGPDGRNLKLQFRSRLSLPRFTGGKVEGEQGAAMHIVLINSNTGHVVTSGPESSAKLDVVVLEGDFNHEDDENWTKEEFESHLVKEREGRRPLLTGDLQVTLKEGVGRLGEVAFTDNSSWIRSRKFRLGLKVSSGCCEVIRIREAKTDAFTVKDHRGESYKKHYPPALTDEVWRLKKIGKDGSFHKRLHKAGIYTVEDFLRLAVRDSQRLRKILGSGMSNKTWDVLLEHAKTCVLSGKIYVYYPDDTRNVGVVFNNTYELSGLIANGQFYSDDSLSYNQKVDVDALVKKAYDNWMHVIEYDSKSLLGFKQNNSTKTTQTDAKICLQDYSNAFGEQVNQQINLPTLSVPAPTEHHHQMSSELSIGGYNDSMVGRFSIESQNGNLDAPVEFDGNSYPPQNPWQSSTPGFQTIGPLNFSSFREDEDFFTEEEIHMRSNEILEEEDMQHLLRFSNMGSHTSFNVSDNGYPYSSWYMPYPSSNYSFGYGQSSSLGKAVLGWLKLKAALRWGIFVRKKAAERRAQLIELEDF
ncbi:Calmodulin_bind domain-containing protein [Cephalotus follicularis]|uniref:Calmodulin_bind domain-containing protein n=1 Tax=Cephalotus follicularis TaxID=3775 RepID=A0A1Q3ATF7_CEPFO|nr:Calmodulin_bind domain-containing protein [Cephalotus follicularis]